MARVIPVALRKSGTLRMPRRRRDRQPVMPQKEAVWRDARSIGALAKVPTAEGQVATRASVSCLASGKAVVRGRDESLNIRTRNRSEGNSNTRDICNGYADGDEPLENDRTDSVDAVDALDDVRRRRRLLSPGARSRIAQKVAEEKIRAAALEKVASQALLTVASRIEKSGARMSGTRSPKLLPQLAQRGAECGIAASNGPSRQSSACTVGSPTRRRLPPAHLLEQSGEGLRECPTPPSRS